MHVVAVDASAMIAYFDPADAHHAAAVAQFVDAARGRVGIAIHPITLAEALVGAARAGDHPAHARRIGDLGVVTTELDVEAPLRLAHLRASTQLRLPDCCVLDVALQTGASLLSFDDRLRAAARILSVHVV